MFDVLAQSPLNVTCVGSISAEEWRSGEVSASRTADMGSIPASPMWFI